MPGRAWNATLWTLTLHPPVPCGALLGRLERLCSDYLEIPKPCSKRSCLSRLGGLVGVLGGLFGGSWRPLEGFGAPLGALLGLLWAVPARLGVFFGFLSGCLGALWLGRLGPLLRLSWSCLGPSWSLPGRTAAPGGGGRGSGGRRRRRRLSWSLLRRRRRRRFLFGAVVVGVVVVALVVVMALVTTLTRAPRARSCSCCCSSRSTDASLPCSPLLGHICSILRTYALLCLPVCCSIRSCATLPYSVLLCVAPSRWIVAGEGREKV